MMKKAAILLAALAIVQCLGIKGNPTEERPTSTRLSDDPSQKAHLLYPRSDWSYFHPSWTIPYLPSVSSVTSFFKDEDDDNDASKGKSKIKNVMKRLEALEKTQKEILELLKKIMESKEPPQIAVISAGSSGIQSNSISTEPSVVLTMTTVTQPGNNLPSKIKDSDENSSESLESTELPVTDNHQKPEDLGPNSDSTTKSSTDDIDPSINQTPDGPGTFVSSSTDSVIVGNPEGLESSVPELSSVSSTVNELDVTGTTMESIKNTSVAVETNLDNNTGNAVTTPKKEDSSSTDPNGQSTESGNLVPSEDKDRQTEKLESTNSQAVLDTEQVPEDATSQGKPSISQLPGTSSDKVDTEDFNVLYRSSKPKGIFEMGPLDKIEKPKDVLAIAKE